MKKFFILIATAAALSFAASEPETHDGFFLSIALGFGYQNIDFVIDDWQSWPSNDAGTATDIDVKVGGRIVNNTLLHATLTGNTRTGTIGSGYESIKVNMSLFGLGVTHYFPGNFFATASAGISQFHANSNVRTFEATVAASANNTEDVNAGFGFQVGGGKEWWVSDNWAVGASAAFLYGFAYNLDDTKESSLGITARISVTWN